MKIILISIASLFLFGCSGKGDQMVKPHEAPDMSKILSKYQNNKDANESVMISRSSMNLFQDNTTYNVGDIITIILNEKTNAQKAASTSTANSAANDIASPTIFGLNPTLGAGAITKLLGNPNTAGDLSFGLESSSNWSGDGSSSQSNSLTGEISVFVMDKTPSGNLIIQGQKKLLINQGNETVVVTGIVRPEDISSGNTIISTKVANADIRYYGEGVVGNSNEQSLFTKFFNGNYEIF